MSATLVATKLREPEPERPLDLVRAHEMLMSFSRHALSCRRRNVEQSRERFEDLAVEVADDALLTCLAFLRERGAVPRFGLPHIVNACAWRVLARRGWTKRELLAGREVAELAGALGDRIPGDAARQEEQEVLVALLRGVPRAPAPGAE